MPFLVQIMQSPRFMVLVLSGFMISVMASPEFPNVNAPLAMILIASITFCLLGISMGFYEDEYEIFRHNHKKSRYKMVEYMLVFAPSFSLSILLLIRLFSRYHFFTRPALLDFGPKKGDYIFASNISFYGGGFSSFGHYIQGFLASFLSRVKCKSKKRDNENIRDRDGGNENEDDPTLTWRCGSTPPDMSFVNIAAYLFTIYPTYNFVKRCIRTPDTFATSSYMNNGMEWALGFWSGHSAGFIADIVSFKKMHEDRATSSSDSTADTVSITSQITAQDEAISSMGITTITPAAEDENKRSCPCSALFVFLMFGWVVGFCFLVSVFGACAMTGYTWNMCEGESTECVNYNAEGATGVIAFVITMVPALAVCAVLF
eukprot:jgi/Psemu1/285919/fgenesh1_pg.108_\